MAMTTAQLTFQGLLDALATVPRTATVKVSGFGPADTPGVLFRHRPFVDGLAITPTIARLGLQSTAAEYEDFLRRTGPGMVWSGDSGFTDQHLAGSETPMWVSLPRQLSFNAITAVEMIRDFAVIRTVNLAPVQGPSIQRIPDEEVVLRMWRLDEADGGEPKVLPAKAEKYLINYAAKGRSDVLLRLAEAIEELDSFESSLQDKRDRVAELQVQSARHDYLLGITDEVPGTITKES